MLQHDTRQRLHTTSLSSYAPVNSHCVSMEFLRSMHSDETQITKKSAETFPNHVCSGASRNLVGRVGDSSGGLSCHYALSRRCSKSHGNSMASMLTAQHLAPNAYHDVISRHRVATGHSFMCPYYHTRKWVSQQVYAE